MTVVRTGYGQNQHLKRKHVYWTRRLLQGAPIFTHSSIVSSRVSYRHFCQTLKPLWKWNHNRHVPACWLSFSPFVLPVVCFLLFCFPSLCHVVELESEKLFDPNGPCMLGLLVWWESLPFKTHFSPEEPLGQVWEQLVWLSPHLRYSQAQQDL